MIDQFLSFIENEPGWALVLAAGAYFVFVILHAVGSDLADGFARRRDAHDSKWTLTSAAFGTSGKRIAASRARDRAQT